MKDKKIALVTGANRGIGFEICRQLAKKGINVILTSRNEEKGKEACKKLEKEGIKVDYHQLDVTNPKSIKKIKEYVEKNYGRLDILVNNAGILLDYNKHGLDVDVNTVGKTMETNIYGPLMLCQEFVPLMKKNNYGRIVNLSSLMGQLSTMDGGYPAYRMSKTCLNALTRIVASEVKDYNILVNSMSPGWVRTDMGGPNAEMSVEEGADTVIWLATLKDNGPSGRFFRDKKEI